MSFFPRLRRARPRALIVDDDALHLRAATRALRPYADVTAAPTAETALRLLETDRDFDLIVCDVQMDRMSGLTFRAIVERDDPELGARIVLISAQPSLWNEPRCLAKPLSITRALVLLADAPPVPAMRLVHDAMENFESS